MQEPVEVSIRFGPRPKKRASVQGLSRERAELVGRWPVGATGEAGRGGRHRAWFVSDVVCCLIEDKSKARRQQSEAERAGVERAGPARLDAPRQAIRASSRRVENRTGCS